MSKNLDQILQAIYNVKATNLVSFTFLRQKRCFLMHAFFVSQPRQRQRKVNYDKRVGHLERLLVSARVTFNVTLSVPDVV